MKTDSAVKVSLQDRVNILNEELINKAEAMNILNLSQAGYFNLVKRGEVRVYNISSFALYSKIEVESLKVKRTQIAELKAEMKNK